MSIQDADQLPDHLFRWLEATESRMREELYRQVAREDLAARGSQGRLLQLIPEQGMRISDLADRARITKQALGQLVNQLEAKGLVVSESDPRDGRVRIVRRSATGEAAHQQLVELIDKVETTLRNEIGAERFDAMKQTLRDLAGERI